MQFWLERIQAEITHVTPQDIDSFAPTEKVRGRDNFAGPLSEDEKRGYVLIERRRKRAEDILRSHMTVCGDADCLEKDNDELTRICSEINALTANFWASVHENRPKLVGKELDVRQGWTLVWVSPNPCPTIQRLMEELRSEFAQL